jgi:zinc protease
MNAGTSYDFTYYHITLPAEHMFLALDILSDLTLNPIFDTTEIERERKVVIEELRRNVDEPTYDFYQNQAARTLSPHPYSRSILGPLETLQSITPAQIKTYFKQYYVLSNMSLVIAGDFDVQKIKDYLQKSPLTSAPTQRIIFPTIPAPKLAVAELRRSTAYGKVQEPRILISYRTPGINHPDMYALDVLDTLLSSGRSSKLYRDLKIEHNLVSSIDSQYDSRQDEALFSVEASLAAANIEKALQQIQKSLEDIQAITQTELQTAKNKLEASEIFAKESVQSQGFFLGYCSMVAQTSMVENYLKNIQKVSVSDIKRVSQKYLKNGYVSVLLPEKMK